MTLASIKKLLAVENPDAYIYDGADDAILGLIYLDTGPILAYSYATAPTKPRTHSRPLTCL